MSWEIVITSVRQSWLCCDNRPFWPGDQDLPRALDRGSSGPGLTVGIGERGCTPSRGMMFRVTVIANHRENIRRKSLFLKRQPTKTKIFRRVWVFVEIVTPFKVVRCRPWQPWHKYARFNIAWKLQSGNKNLRRMNQGEGQVSLCWLWPLCFVSVLLFSSSGKSFSCFSLGFLWGLSI